MIFLPYQSCNDTQSNGSYVLSLMGLEVNVIKNDDDVKVTDVLRKIKPLFLKEEMSQHKRVEQSKNSVLSISS